MSAPASARTDAIILCSKIREPSTRIRIRDMYQSAGGADAAVTERNGWSRESQTSYWETYVVDGSTCVRVCDCVRTSASEPDAIRHRYRPFHVPPLSPVVHHQFAIMFHMPPYHNPNITSSVEVLIALVDTLDGTESMPITFVYNPSGTCRLDRAMALWRRPTRLTRAPAGPLSCANAAGRPPPL